MIYIMGQNKFFNSRSIGQYKFLQNEIQNYFLIIIMTSIDYFNIITGFLVVMGVIFIRQGNQQGIVYKIQN